MPLTLKWASEQHVSLLDAIARITLHPARVLGLDAGCLGVGQAADICIFNPETHWVVEAAALKSQGKNTPFLGYEMQAAVVYTLVDGQIVYDASK